ASLECAVSLAEASMEKPVDDELIRLYAVSAPVACLRMTPRYLSWSWPGLRRRKRLYYTPWFGRARTQYQAVPVSRPGLLRRAVRPHLLTTRQRRATETCGPCSPACSASPPPGPVAPRRPEGDQRAGQENEALEAEPPVGRPGDNTLGCGDRPLPRGWRGHQACTSWPGSGTSLRPDRALTRARMRRSKPMPVGNAHGFP